MAKLFFIATFFIFSSLRSFSFNSDELSKYDDFNTERSCSYYEDKSIESTILNQNQDATNAEGFIDFATGELSANQDLRWIRDYDKNNVEYDIINQNIISDQDKYLANNQVFVPQDLLMSDYSGYGCLKDYMIGYLLWRSTLSTAVFICGGKPMAFYNFSKEDLRNKKFSAAVASAFSTFNPANDLIDFSQALVKCSSKLAVLLPTIVIIIGYYADGVEKMKLARKIAKQVVVCGHNWQLWGDNGYDEIVNDGDKKYSSQYKFDYIKRDQKIFYGYYSYLKKFALIGNKEIRELQNKGVERKNFNCQNPNFSKHENNYNHQKYYFRGSEAAHYGCQQYHPRNYDLSKETKNSRKDYEDAYNCCIRYQTKSICLEKLSQKFDGDNEQKKCTTKDDCYYQHCIEGEDCEVNINVYARNLDIYYSDSDSSNTKICAKTNDICPFNIPISLGIEKRKCEKYQDLSLADSTKIQEVISDQLAEDESQRDFFEAKEICDKYKTRKWNNESNICQSTPLLNQCKNYCAIDNHCVKITPAPKENNSNDYSAFFSSACVDFRGSSKMEGSLLTPLAQCFRETASNFLFNKAGRSVGNYLKGDIVMESSFLTQMQDLVKDSITIAMVIAVILVGLGLLIGANQFDKKAVMFLVAQIALISWFALGDAWKKTFFDIIYNTSTTFISLVNSMSKKHKDNNSYYKIEEYSKEKYEYYDIIEQIVQCTNYKTDNINFSNNFNSCSTEEYEKDLPQNSIIKNITFSEGGYYAEVIIDNNEKKDNGSNKTCEIQKVDTDTHRATSTRLECANRLEKKHNDLDLEAQNVRVIVKGCYQSDANINIEYSFPKTDRAYDIDTENYQEGLNVNKSDIETYKKKPTYSNVDCKKSTNCRCRQERSEIIALSKKIKDMTTTYQSLEGETIIAQTGKENCILKERKFVDNVDNNTYDFKDKYECRGIFSQKNDGCYFHPGEYQKGDEYLAIWDTMDCKIRLYLGFGSSKWGILGLILSSVVTGVWGMYLAIATLAFGIFVFILAANILYMFVFSSFLLVLLVFVSPITITLSLFSATRSIFHDWFKYFMSFALQPIILFFYMAFVILMFDKFMIRGALFIDKQKANINVSLDNELFEKENMCLRYGGKYENARCTKQGNRISLPQKEKFCEETLGGEYSNQQGSCLNIFVPPSKRPYTPSCEQYYLDSSGKYHKDRPSSGEYELVNPEITSPVCILQSEATGLEGFGNLFATPIRALFSVAKGSDNSVLKSMAITMLEIAIFMYIISMFTAKIPEIAANLTNGEALPQIDFGVKSIINKGSDFASGAAKRFSNSFKRPIGDDNKKDNRIPIPSKDGQKDDRMPIPAKDTQNQNDNVIIDKKSKSQDSQKTNI